MNTELGNICRCEHPKRIINPYTDEVLYVECRKCASCLNIRAAKWKLRVSNECKLHKYSMFVTLTYDEKKVPRYIALYDDIGNIVQFDSNKATETFNPIIEDEIPNDVKELSDTETLGAVKYSDEIGHYVNSVCRTDVKLFFKRLRSNIDYLFKKKGYKNENKKIRYFICSEYGPRTLRPHYHAIIWFDSEKLLEHFGTLLRKSWQNGYTDCSLVNSSAPSYVAKYVSGNSCLPEILQLKYTKPFHFASKNPSIGYNETYTQAIEDNAINGTYGLYQYDATTQQRIYIPTPSSIEMRYLPKCRNYRFASHFEKLRIYSYAYELYQFETDPKFISKLLHDKFESSVDIHCSYACLNWCLKWNCTPEIYLVQLEDYYSRKELYQIRTKYEYQIRYIANGYSLSHFLDFDPTIYERLPQYQLGFEDSDIKHILLSHGVTADMIYTKLKIDPKKVMALKQSSSDFYKANVLKQRKQHNDSLKNKYLNETIKANLFNP